MAIKQVIPYLLTFGLCLALVLILFNSGLLLASGESGMPFHNFPRLLPLTTSAWNEIIIGKPGHSAGFLFFLPIYLLHQIGFSEVATQMVFYFIILLIGSWSIIRLTSLVTTKPLPGILSGSFYLLNLFTLVSVINRLLYPFLYFYALLPLSLYILIQSVNQRKLMGALVLSVCSVIFSLGLASFPFLALWWLTILSYLLYTLITQGLKPIKFIVLFLLILSISWLSLNIWWLLPLLFSTFSTSYASEVITSSGSLIALMTLSQLVGGLIHVLGLSDKSFFVYTSVPWGKFYLNPLITLLGLLPAIIIFLLPFKKRLNSLSVYLLSLLIVSVFFSKGTSPPLGEVPQYLVKHIPLYDVFRNSFEKIGFLQIVPFSVLFGVSLASFSKKIILLVIIIVFILLPHPIWNGSVLKLSEVQVPTEYDQLNQFLTSDPEQFRTLALPITGEGATYTWEHPYNGVELSGELLSRPTISHITSIPYLDNIGHTLKTSFASNPAKFDTLLPLLNIKYILVRHDLDINRRQLADPEFIESQLNKTNYSNTKNFTDLHLYENNLHHTTNIFTSSNITYSYPEGKFSDYLLLPNVSPSILLDYQSNQPIPGEILVKPLKDVTLSTPPQMTVDQAEKILPAAKYSPGSLKHTLVRLKEKFEMFGLSNNEGAKMQFRLTLLGKRLMEIALSAKSSTSNVTAAINTYKENFSQMFLNPANTPNLKWISQRQVAESFVAQRLVLSQLKETTVSTSLREAISDLDNYIVTSLAETGYGSLYQSPSKADTYRVLRFNVPQTGIFDINLLNDNFEKNFNLTQNQLLYSIDGKNYISTPKFNTNIVNIGRHEFTKGTHEITVIKPESKNLIPTANPIMVTNTSDVVLSFTNFSSGSQYEIGFDYFFDKGDGFYVEFIQNNDFVSTDLNRSFTKYRINKNDYDHGTLHYSNDINTYTDAISGLVRFAMPPFNICPESKLALFDKCEDENYRKLFDKPTQVSINNLNITKKFTNPLFLTGVNNISNNQLPTIAFNKLSSAQYKVNVSNANFPFVLLLLQNYHPGWTARFSDSTQSVLKHDRAIGYANGWIVNRTGDYEIVIKYEPEKMFYSSFYVSLFSGIIIISAILLSLRKKNA